jgi:hypothetical protein
MNILLWYLPYAMFSGACDIVLSKSERIASGPAESAERNQEADEPAAWSRSENGRN